MNGGIGGAGGNGHWVRTRNKEGAQSFLAERKMEAEPREAQRERERLFFADVRSWIRRLFTRS
ncbi:MAG TPA: hypothetical protein VK059_11070 [Nocardioidaceae bacterium]|nr:hypothetical protein [Nocardioidaceae bacterium]